MSRQTAVRKVVRKNPSSYYNWIRKSKEPRSSSSDLSEDELRQIYKLVPSDGSGPKRLNAYCNFCKQFLGSIKGDRCDRLLDYEDLLGHAVVIHGAYLTSEKERDDTKKPRSGLSEDELRNIYSLVPADGPGSKRLNARCTICEFRVDSIEGDRLLDHSELQNHAVNNHADFRRIVNKRNEEDARATFHELPFHKNYVLPHQSHQTKMEEDDYVQDSVNKMEVDDYVQDSVNNGENSGKAIFPELPSAVPIPSSDFSEHQLRQLFKLVRSRGLSDILNNNKEPTMSLVCKLCSFVADLIEEGSSFQDSHAAHRHASLHRDRLDEFPTECDEFEDNGIPNYSEAELLRIYLVESYTQDYRRPGVPPPKKPAVSYLVVCKICKRALSTTRIYPTCLGESLDLQEHASLHSEYLCMDGPAVPELDLEDYKKDWVLGYEGEIREEDLYTPMEEGYVRICRRCYSENCSSGFYMASLRGCYICDTNTHWDWDCPKWKFERPTPCNGSTSCNHFLF